MKKEEFISNSSPGRRIFLQNLLLGAFSTSLASARLLSGKERQDEQLKKGKMFYRRLGRTNLLISEIALGGSPLPDMPILLQAIERGVNYIDTSQSYQNGNSERQIGQLLKLV